MLFQMLGLEFSLTRILARNISEFIAIDPNGAMDALEVLTDDSHKLRELAVNWRFCRVLWVPKRCSDYVLQDLFFVLSHASDLP